MVSLLSMGRSHCDTLHFLNWKMRQPESQARYSCNRSATEAARGPGASLGKQVFHRAKYCITWNQNYYCFRAQNHDRTGIVRAMRVRADFWSMEKYPEDSSV